MNYVYVVQDNNNCPDRILGCFLTRKAANAFIRNHENSEDLKITRFKVQK